MEEERKKLHLKNLLEALIETDIVVDGGTVSVSGNAANATVVTNGGPLPLYDWPSGSQISPGFVKRIGEKRREEGKEGAVFLSPVPFSTANLRLFKEYGMICFTYDNLIGRLREKKKKISELGETIARDKNEFIELGPCLQAQDYQNLIEKVESSKDRESKKKTLEELVGFFAQDLKLTGIEINKKTPSSEIDVRAKSERIVGIWSELGTPIIFEAKNWEDPVSADQIRNLVGKATPARTRFLIAWNGVTGKDELRSARLEIIKAKAKGNFVLVLTKDDFLKIAAGTHPEKLVENRYYALIYDKIE